MRTASLRMVGAALVVAALCGACGGDDDDATTTTTRGSTGPSGAGTTKVVILKNVVFNPDKLTIDVGDTVEWKWDDGANAHNVVGEGFESELVSSGTFEHTFATAGTFDYRCTVHPTMTGKIIAK